MYGQKPTRPTVLIVDDERLIRWSLFESLTALGYPVRVASSGAEARALLPSCRADALVVVLDLRLPDVSDLSLLEELRSRFPAAPVIVVSAFGGEEIRAATTALGAAGFVDKPFDVREVANLIGRVWRPPQD
jgi:DNA-binding NtrC family response regulator